MPDEMFTRPPAALASAPARRRGGASLRALVGLTLLAFVGGALLVGYLVWDGRITISNSAAPPAPAASPAVGFAQRPAPAGSDAAALGGLDQRIAALEARLTRIDQQAAAAEGNAARAEALLVAFAARRAIERGAPLGILEGQLRQHFGAVQPAAVQVVIEAARAPLTLGQLSQQLDALAPALSGTPADESGWDRISREVGSLFVIRHGEVSANRPEDRLDRVRLLLRTGQVDAAADEVARMPGSPAASAWIANARRLAATGRALDLIEAAALSEPQGGTPPRSLQTSAPPPALTPAPTPNRP